MKASSEFRRHAAERLAILAANGSLRSNFVAACLSETENFTNRPESGECWFDTTQKLFSRKRAVPFFAFLFNLDTFLLR
jgi:hypothetical protein